MQLFRLAILNLEILFLKMFQISISLRETYYTAETKDLKDK